GGGGQRNQLLLGRVPQGDRPDAHGLSSRPAVSPAKRTTTRLKRELRLLLPLRNASRVLFPSFHSGVAGGTRMIDIAGGWRRLWARIQGRSVEMRLGIRGSIAAVASFLLSRWLDLPLALWTVLTAIILTQMSVGRSLNATINYMIGTLGGAIYSGAVAVLIPHETELALLVVLAIGIAPMAMLAAIDPRFSTAPFTAVLVLLAPTLAHLTPLESATY